MIIRRTLKQFKITSRFGIFKKKIEQMKKAFKWTLIAIAVVYSLIVFVAPAVMLWLFSDKHVTYHRVYRAEEAGLTDPDTLMLKT